MTDKGRIKKNSQIWNAIYSFLNAGQSALMLFVIIRICGEDQAGVFSIAFSIAYLMIMIGSFGVRSFHSTDVVQAYSFGDYVFHRFVTCMGMIICSILYVLIKGYNFEKSFVVLACCSFRLIESIEDVIHGEYQRRDRLDIACIGGTVRYIVCIVFFVLSLAYTHNLIISLITMDLSALITFILFTLFTFKMVVPDYTSKKNDWKRLFVTCFPLFLSNFLNIYICNASKYAIDDYYSDAIQGYYGVLFMPVFIINLLCICIYRPKLVDLASNWNNGNRQYLINYMKKQLFAIVVIGICVIIAADLIGIKLLSIFFTEEIIKYRMELLILLFGGTMTAIVDFSCNLITVIRKQYILIYIYGVISILAFCCSRYLVKNLEIKGAAVSYSVVIMVQAIIMSLCLFKELKKENTR